jgi:hypothetical protein
VTKRKTTNISPNHFTAPMQTEASRLVNFSAPSKLLEVARCLVTERFVFRQGLWIEDLRIPPGQECSNGSLILLAVVLWRTFLPVRARPRQAMSAVEGGRRFLTSYETPQNKNSPVLAGRGKMRQARCLHSLAKAGGRSAFSNPSAEQPDHDCPKERERNRLRNNRLQSKERRDLSHLSQVVKAFHRQTNCRHRLVRCS